MHPSGYEIVNGTARVRSFDIPAAVNYPYIADARDLAAAALAAKRADPANANNWNVQHGTLCYIEVPAAWLHAETDAERRAAFISERISQSYW